MAEKIAWAAEAHGGFDLFFVVANTRAATDGFCAALRRALPGAATVDLRNERRRLLAVLRDDVPDATAVLVTEIEPHVAAAGASGSLFGVLNLDRDAIRALDKNLVFVLPSYALTALAQSAPDFYDYRTVTLEAPGQPLSGDLASLQLGAPFLALNPRDRDRWIEILRAQRADPYSEEDVQRQLRLARLLAEKGDYVGAESLLRGLLMSAERSRTPTPRLSMILNDLGRVLYNRGDLDGALAAFREAERINRAALGDDHPDVAADVGNAGIVLRQRGDLDGALAAFREAERIDRAALGDDHPRVAADVVNAGLVLSDRDDVDGALVAFREAFLIFFRTNGPRGEHVRAAANNVAWAGGDPVALVRERIGTEAALEFEKAFNEG